jgi:hypothetical protein
MISVCYLVRFRKGKNFTQDINSLKKFYFSYCLYNAGVMHKLFILIKGPMADDSIKIIRKILPTNVPIIKLADEGYDLGSFTEFARYRAESYMFILNQHSVILCKNWLKIYYTVLTKTKSKIVASTASMSSLANSYYTEINSLNTFIKYYLINMLKKIKAKYYFFHFPKYPNPHIRTNALLIKTSLWLNYFKDLHIKSKFQCHEIESGKKSFYNYLKKKEIIAIVKRNGQFVTKESDWINFVPFRNKMQRSNLIISDNQTRFYHKATADKKIHLELETWRKYN